LLWESACRRDVDDDHGDADGNGTVDARDVAFVLSRWGAAE
jgi:hypothetical protein